MSIRIEIKDFQNGIADSPNSGFSNFQGMDVFSSPGYALQYPAIFDQISSDSVSMGLPKYFAYDPLNLIYYMQDDMGQVWARTSSIAWTLISGNTLTGALGQGIVVWQGYLFAFRANAIDLLLCSSTFTTPVWTNGWKNQSVTYNGTTAASSGLIDNQTFVSNFNGAKMVFSVYVTTFNRAFMMSISTVFGKVFNPSDSSTYQYLQNGSDPNIGQPVACPVAGIWITSIEQLGALLYSGTSGNLIFPWDEVSIYFSTPLVCPEIGVRSMKRINNILYISVGQRANIYYSNGSVVELFKRFPIYLYQNVANGSSSHANGFVSIPKIEAMKGRLIMCVQGFSGNNINGLYILNIETKALVMYNVMPQGGNAQPQTVIPDQTDSDAYFIGYRNNTRTAIASQNQQFNFPTDFSSFFVTGFYSLGQKLQPETVARLNIMLTSVLRANQKIRVSYRTDLSAAFSPILPQSTLDTNSGEPTPNGFEVPTGIEKAVNLEFKFEFAAEAEIGASNFSIELQKVIFYNDQ